MYEPKKKFFRLVIFGAKKIRLVKNYIAKNPTKIHGKNLLKIPCGQKSVWISQKLL
tara:strand:- start:1005 stop:1172 length:168 start_codon:yes stop_codon:yes gene_type:complete